MISVRQCVRTISLTSERCKASKYSDINSDSAWKEPKHPVVKTSFPGPNGKKLAAEYGEIQVTDKSLTYDLVKIQRIFKKVCIRSKCF